MSPLYFLGIKWFRWHQLCWLFEPHFSLKALRESLGKVVRPPDAQTPEGGKGWRVFKVYVGQL